MNAEKSTVRYYIQNANDYDVEIRLGNDHSIFYGYSKKKIKKIYSKEGYIVAGEVKRNSDKKKIGELATGDVVSQTGAHSSLFHRTEGYLCIGRDTYIAVLRTRILLPLLLFFGALLMVMTLFWSGKHIFIQPGETIPAIGPIDGDTTTKPVVEEGGGSVTMVWSLDAEVNLSKRTVEVLFQNPYASTHDIKVELYILSKGEEILVARSGLVKAGYALNRMDLLESIELAKGTYTGIYRVIGYDPASGEKAAVLPQIPNVVITAK